MKSSPLARPIGEGEKHPSEVVYHASHTALKRMPLFTQAYSPIKVFLDSLQGPFCHSVNQTMAEVLSKTTITL